MTFNSVLGLVEQGIYFSKFIQGHSAEYIISVFLSHKYNSISSLIGSQTLVLSSSPGPGVGEVPYSLALRYEKNSLTTF